MNHFRLSTFCVGSLDPTFFPGLLRVSAKRTVLGRTVNITNLRPPLYLRPSTGWHPEDPLGASLAAGSRHWGVQSHIQPRINQFGVVESPPLAAARTLTYHRMHTHTANIGFVDASASRSPPLSARRLTRRGHHTCTLAASRLCIHRRRRHPRGRHLQLRSTTVQHTSHQHGPR